MRVYYFSDNPNGFCTGKRFTDDREDHPLSNDVPKVPRTGRPPQLFDAHDAKPPYRVPLVSEIRKIKPNGFKVATTFAGAGGSSTGYRLAGFQVVWANEFVPIAQESYRANAMPYTVVDGRDIKQVQAAEILAATKLRVGELDVFDGSPPCFVAGTLILTRRGLTPIENVREGDMVVTHESRWRRVTARMERMADTVSVRGQGHPGIGTTLEHPFMVRRSASAWDNSARTNLRSFGAPEWRQIGRCSPNGQKGSRAESFFWSMPRVYPDDAIPKVCRADARSAAVDLTAEFFWLVGLWLGDGWLRTGRAHAGTSNRGEVLICANKEQAGDVRERIAAAGLPFSEAKMRTTVRFTICHAGLTDWLEEDFGRGAAGKTMASWAFGMPAEWRRALLDGYFFADGTAPREGYRRATSISWPLMLGMAMIARSLGIATSMRCQTCAANVVIENRRVNVADATYALDCYDKPRSFLVEEDRCWGKIKQINPGERTMVYNISVEEDESYLADGLIVHNCQAFSTAGKREKGWGTEKRYEHGASQKNEELFFDYIRLRDGLMPKVFVAENVSGLVKGTAKGFFLEILKELRRGYRVRAPLLDAQWLGVPQARQRIIFIGVREDLDVDPPQVRPLPYRYSVRDALPWLGGEVMSSGHSFAERPLELDDPAKTVLANEMGGSYRGARVVRDTRGSFKSGGDITNRPSPTILSSQFTPHHFQVHGAPPPGDAVEFDTRGTGTPNGPIDVTDRPSPTIMAGGLGKTSGQVVGDGPSIDGQAIGREWDKLNPGQHSEKYFSLVRPDPALPSPTLTAAGGANAGIATVVHPTEKRKFTILEVKRLCSFPDDFELRGTYGQQWERLGNSVPPVMMQRVAEAIRDDVLVPARARTLGPAPRSGGRSTKVKSRTGGGRPPPG